MKAYTDLEQSKKLAEILPIESADMMYHSVENEYGTGTFVATSKFLTNGLRNDDFYIDDIPCWSLAALLEQLPEIINYEDDESDYALEISKENDLYYLSYGNPFEHGKLEVEPQENFVDACYEMILKLHELNLL